VVGYLGLTSILFPISVIRIAWLIPLFVVGVFFDGIAIQMGWLQLYLEHEFFWIPHWLVAIWFLYLFTLPVYLKIFALKWYLPLVLGFFLGPLAYKAGEPFKICALSTTAGMLAYALFWAAFFPLSIYHRAVGTWLGRGRFFKT